MYKIRIEKVEELMLGRKINYISDITGYSRTYLSEIFNQKRLVNEKKLKSIIISICNDSTKLKEFLEKQGLEKTINYFFEKI